MPPRLLASTILVLICASDIVSADEPGFKSPAAKRAQLRFEDAVEGARKDYTSALTTALRDATKRGDLEEANAISAAIKKVDESAAAEKKFGTQLANTRWRLSGQTAHISFMQDGTVNTTWGTKGIWKVATPQTVIAKIETPEKQVFTWQVTVDPNSKFALLVTPELDTASILELMVDAK